MTIPTISTLPVAPARTDAPATFVTRADAFLAAMVVMQGELNTSIGAINTDIGGIAANVTAAQAAKTAAELAETNAETAETNASTSETNAQIYAAAAQAAAGVPSLTGNAGKALLVNTGATGVEWAEVETDPTKATLSQTFLANGNATLTLSTAITAGAPVVSVTKEVAQTGVTNNNWDAAAGSYTLENSAYSTTLSFVGFDISTASYTQSFSVSSQDTAPAGIAFNSLGTKMFVIGATGDDVNEYTLSTGFDVSTASFVTNFSVSSQDTDPAGLAFNTDGTKMFVSGSSANNVNEYTLSTGYDVSTASFSQSFSVSAQVTHSWGLAFSTDGTKMFVVDLSGQDVNEYTLSTGFDVSTASFVDSFSISAQEAAPTGLSFSNNGTKMFVLGVVGQDVNEYTLSTGYDVSTASFSQSFSVSGQDTSAYGITFNSNGTKMFVVGATSDSVYQYAISISSIALGTGSFASTDVGKTINVNDGVLVLTATNGSYAETIAPTTTNTAASGEWSMFGLVYDDTADVLEISNKLTNAFNISTSTFVDSFSVSGQDTNPRSVAFNPDGTKMFIVGDSGNDVSEYTLSVGFDVSTASFVDGFLVSGQDTNPMGIAFNTDGTKMFIAGDSSNNILEYTLTTGFDVSTASFAQSFSVASQENLLEDVAFNTDGTKMFVLGRSVADVNEYTLSTGFDISTSTFIDSFSVSAKQNSPNGLTFNPDGTKMFIVGDQAGTANIDQYTLSAGFDVSSASFLQTFSVLSQVGVPQGIAFNAGGTKMFIVDSLGDDVNEYTVGSTFKATGYQLAISGNIDSTYWTDINSLTATNAIGDGNVFYAISNDNKTAWSVLDNTSGTRKIVKNNSGTWQYNSNSTYGSETWVNATTNTEFAALREAMAVTVNKMNSTTLNAITDANQITLGDDLDFAAILYFASGSTVPTYSGTAINYDANILNQGAVLGTDYNFDVPASNKVRITAVGAGNYKVRVV